MSHPLPDALRPPHVQVTLRSKLDAGSVRRRINRDAGGMGDMATAAVWGPFLSGDPVFGLVDDRRVALRVYNLMHPPLAATVHFDGTLLDNGEGTDIVATVTMPSSPSTLRGVLKRLTVAVLFGATLGVVCGMALSAPIDRPEAVGFSLLGAVGGAATAIALQAISCRAAKARAELLIRWVERRLQSPA